MTVPFELLGLIPAGPIRHALKILGPVLIEVMKKWPQPEGPVSNPLGRIGDLLVWNSDRGKQVVAAIETLGESQRRIESAVSGIESTQLAMASTLGTVQALSMATFGITSLSAGFMVWRLHALNKRLDRLSRQVADIEARLDARDRALLDGSLSFLHEYERQLQNEKHS